MKTKALIGLFALPIVAVLGHANNDEQTVMGTVKAISGDAVTVETMGNALQSVIITVPPATRFIKDGTAASLKDLKVGDHLVASVKPNGDKLKAAKIVFGKMFDHMDMHRH